MNVHLAATIVVAALSFVSASPVALSTPQQGVTVRGSVFDSLAMKPVVGAAVWIAGGNQIAKSDSAGRFVLTGVTTGKRFVEFSSSALDSLQLGTLGTAIDVGLDGTSVALATPSFASLRRALCKNSGLASADSGIMWGTLRDAATDTRLHGAKLTLAWTELQVDRDKQVAERARSREVFSDSTGNYYACGLPVGTNMLVQATGSGSFSGVITHSIGAQQLSRLDVLVSAEMVAADAAAKRGSATVATLPATRGTATARIVVRDEKQRAVAQSSVTISALDSVLLTDANGVITIPDLPAGTHVVTARKIGAAPATAILQLRPGAVSDLDVTVNSVTELATVDVKGEAFRSRDRLDFEDRRRVGFGYALDAKSLVGKPNLTAALMVLPNIELRGGGRGPVIVPSVRNKFKGCDKVAVWIDGVAGDLADVQVIPVENLRGVEWYPRGGSAPARYDGGCGTILFWTVASRWGK